MNTFMINPAKRFRDSSAPARANYKGSPGNIREAFFLYRPYENGIFQIEGSGELKLYDRCYVFSDINYKTRDPDAQKSILYTLQEILAFMSADFKITVANEYRSMRTFLKDAFMDLNKEKYPEISRGMREWIAEKIATGNIADVEKVLYLTISVRAYSYEEARSYFLGMDAHLEHLFLKLGSVILPLNAGRRLESLRKFFYLDTDTTPVSFAVPGYDPVRSILPASVAASEMNFMVFNQNRYVSVLFARNFAAGIDDVETMYRLTRVAYPSFFTIDCAPVGRDTLNSYLSYLHTSTERAISQELDEKNRNGLTMAGISYAKEKTLEEIEAITDQVNEHDEACIQAGLLAVVSADSEEELAQRVKNLVKTAKETGIQMETYNWVQLKAFNTALPIGGRQVGHRRAFLTGELVCLQPFYAQDLCDLGGFFYGQNTTTRQLVIKNRKSLASPHGMIVGHTGSGKSMVIKMTEVSQTLLTTADDLTVIDPQNEMQGICAAYGGQFIDFTAKSDCFINPMEIPEEVRRNTGHISRNRFVADVTTWANSFCAAIMHNILYTQEHRSAVGECIRSIYEKAFDGRRKKVQPTIVDLRSELKLLADRAESEEYKSQIMRIYHSLTEYTEGAYDMFAHPSNVDINNRFVVFGLHNVPEDNWEPVMISIMFFLSNRMEYNQVLQKATRLIIDEAQTVAKNRTSADIMLKAIVTYRKYGGICTLALQNLTRAMENPELRDMFSNCGYKLFLDQGGVDASTLAEIQELSRAEYEFLSKEIPGCGLMVWGKKAILLDAQVAKTNILYERFSTNFHEKQEKGAGVLLPEEGGLEGKILKLAEVVPVSAEDVALSLDIPASEAASVLSNLCMQGYLVSSMKGGTAYFHAEAS